VDVSGYVELSTGQHYNPLNGQTLDQKRRCKTGCKCSKHLQCNIMSRPETWQVNLVNRWRWDDKWIKRQ
jgi:hypothetical protein